ASDTYKQVEYQRETEVEIGLFDWNEIPENQPAAHEDLEALFGEATDELPNSPSLLEAATDELSWDEDFFTSERSESETEIQLQTDNKIEVELFDGNENIEISPVDNQDLLALFSETTDDLSADSSLSESSIIGDLNWDEDLLIGQTSDPEIELNPEREAETRLFDWEEIPQPTQSDRENLEALFGEATDNISEYPSLSGSSIDDLNWEEDVVYNEVYESGVPAELNTNKDSIKGAVNWEEINELDELDALLNRQGIPNISDSINELDELDALLDSPDTQSISTSINELDELDALLDLDTTIASGSPSLNYTDSFDRLDSLLDEITPKQTNKSKEIAAKTPQAQDSLDDELEEMLKQAEQSMGGTPTNRSDQRQNRPQPRRIKMFEQNMRVSAKHLDSLSNLVGELVVSRNSLEQDQERLRQFLDNLQHQVIALSDVGSRMRDLYERSLLEGSLLASHHNYRTSFNSEDRSQNNNSSGVEYHPLEMDRFTGFHLLSQEMIELIVQVRESASDIEFLVEETDQVTRNLRQVTTQLQEGLTRSRMVPFAQNADRLHRAVRDISMKLGKEAQLSVDGRESLIDKMILEHLNDPMTHLVNNALTHGIETPDIRKAAGKPAVGQIVLNAFHQGNQTVISISDDGAGIDPERIRRKAIEQKLITPAEAKTLTRLDLYDFLFHPGFTTKDQADDFSGRGVGMDVVRTSLSEIRGDIYIDSTLGKGTTFTIRLPLTLSICKALCCLSERARIAFPIDGVEDMFDLPSDRIQINEEGKPCIRWRDTLLTFQPLSDLLAYNRQLSRGNVYGGKREDDLISIVVLRSPGNFLAIQVDQVLGEQEIVIKQLEGPAPKPVGIAGATVLGDGKIMPIADVLELIDLSLGRLRKDSAMIWLRDEPQIPSDQDTETVHEPMVLIVDDSITVRELLSLTFSKAGYRVEQARDGQEAWEKLRSGLPCDIVFCDIEMPRMDGLELLSRLQKDETLSQIPIAMLTSRGAKRHRQMASQLGASGYFTKPYLEEALLDAAKRMRKGEILLTATED
ncbi:hybrid sensor histidine kinase/response regulator, partial [Limnofasciculus baicalensis]